MTISRSDRPRPDERPHASSKRGFGIQLFFSQIIWFLYICWKILASVIVVPWHLALHPSDFVLHKIRNFVDHLINVRLDFSPSVRTLDLPGLRTLLEGPLPRLNLRFENRFGNVNFQEAIVLAYLVQARSARRIFEIGTFDGYSTYHLAKNAPEDARIFTLNLPVESALADYQNAYDLIIYHGDAVTHEQLSERGVGALFRSTDVAERITQLFGDSMTFDFSPYRRNMDLCFIDGGHTRAHVESDTRNALSMVVPGGIIIWHDYNVQHRDIFRFLNQLAGFHTIYRIQHTRLAFMIAPKS